MISPPSGRGIRPASRFTRSRTSASRAPSSRFKNREKLAALGTLTAGLAHEIRNPLSIIRASAELLQEEEEAKGETAFGRGIVEEVDRLSGLLTRFLEFARPQQEDVRRDDLGLLVSSVLDRVEREFDEKGVELVRDLQPSKMTVHMDTRQIEQVVLNLLLNARDAVNGEGRVALTLGTRRKPRSSARFPAGAARHEEFAEVMVEDTGSGIDKEHVDRLFDPFFTTKEKGTGLGLSIVHGIVQGHDGYVCVESEKGRGTRIGFGLPV
jgi:signal transduction histidine kinase